LVHETFTTDVRTGYILEVTCGWILISEYSERFFNITR